MYTRSSSIMIKRLTTFTLWSQVFFGLAVSLTQERTFLLNPSLADVIFTQDLVFDAVARSHLHCLRTCVTTPCCRAYTYTRQSSAVRGRVGCRGYSAVMTANTASLSAPGARTFYRTRGNRTVTRNVAVGKPAVQSSVYDPKTTADKAVDNNTDSNYFATTLPLGRWILVSYMTSLLSSSRTVETAAVRSFEIWWAETEVWLTASVKFGNRLRDFVVNVYIENPMITPAAMETSCYNYSGPMAQGATEELHCDCGVVTGRYVRLTNPNSDHLQLCEVQVFALDNE